MKLIITYVADFGDNETEKTFQDCMPTMLELIPSELDMERVMMPVTIKKVTRSIEFSDEQ